jgi:hypothetical protein
MALRVPILEDSSVKPEAVAAAFKQVDTVNQQQSAVLAGISEYLGKLQEKGILPKAEESK